MGVTHFLILSKTDSSPYLRVGRTPQGPTLTFKIHGYSLAADVIKAQLRPRCHKDLFQNPPLVTAHFPITIHGLWLYRHQWLEWLIDVIVNSYMLFRSVDCAIWFWDGRAASKAYYHNVSEHISCYWYKHCRSSYSLTLSSLSMLEYGLRSSPSLCCRSNLRLANGLCCSVTTKTQSLLISGTTQSDYSLLECLEE